MPKQNRLKTSYQGVYYIQGMSPATGKPERIYYIRYRQNGEMTEEKVGRQFQNDMTPSRAARVRALRIHGDQLSNREQRDLLEIKKQKEDSRWTIHRLWSVYKDANPGLKGIGTDENRFKNYVNAMGGPGGSGGNRN